MSQFVRCFGGGLNLNVHYHTLLFDGVFFADGASGAIAFRPLPPPTDEEVGGVLARIATRVQRLLKRRGLDTGDAGVFQADPVVEESPVLAGISSASIQGRIAFGPRAGARVWRVEADPDAPLVLSTAPRHAHVAGFDLHANVDAPAADRHRLEQLCRYLLRPAVAQDRLRLLSDGRVMLTLKTAWADGTRQLLFEPLELLEKLAALIPRPRINLVIYHGVLAPHSSWRARLLAYGAPPTETPVVASTTPQTPSARSWPPSPSRGRSQSGRRHSRRRFTPATRRRSAPERHRTPQSPKSVRGRWGATASLWTGTPVRQKIPRHARCPLCAGGKEAAERAGGWECRERTGLIATLAVASPRPSTPQLLRAGC